MLDLGISAVLCMLDPWRLGDRPDRGAITGAAASRKEVAGMTDIKISHGSRARPLDDSGREVVKRYPPDDHSCAITINEE